MTPAPGPTNKWKQLLWLLIPALIGVGVFLAAPLLKKPPQRSTPLEHPVKVRTIRVSPIDVVPHAIGYGKILPTRTWEAVSEVSGQVEWIAETLEDGAVVESGTELLRIDDANIRLQLAQTNAQIKAADVKVQSARESLKNARTEVELLAAEYRRKKSLAERGAMSQAATEAAQLPLLAAQTRLTNLQNTIDVGTAERQVLVAQRDAAQLDLTRTRKLAPFDVRITTVKIGVAQYANKGQLLFSGDGLASAEVIAQFPVGILRPLIAAPGDPATSAIEPGALGMSATVRLRTATHTVSWPAKVDRVSGSIDPQTQSVGVVVSVDNPLAAAEPGNRPPLLRNTFVEVELSAKPLEKRIVIPAGALHDGKVYLVNAQSRLELRAVQVAFSQRGYTVLGGGLVGGEHLVISGLTTPIEGMLLAGQPDDRAAQRLTEQATGTEPRP